MKHEFLNGDAMKEIIQDNSIDLFIMWPPYLGVDVQRYGHTFGQINNVSDVILFSKRLAKIAKNCEKALKETGNLIYILPTTDPNLSGQVLRNVIKKTKLQYNGRFIWHYRDDKTASTNQINVEHCDILWFSKDKPKVNMEYLAMNSSSIINIPLNPEELVEDYGHMGNVLDTLPVNVAEHFIELLSAPGDTVANVLSGTGSVSIAAENLGRDSVYNDISFVQLTIAKKRMEDLIMKKKRSKVE